MQQLLDVDSRPDFDALAALQNYLRRLLDEADDMLRAFHIPDSGGFAHRIDTVKPKTAPRLSRASTATCVAMLAATGRLVDKPWGPERGVLVDELLAEPWDSASLGPDNAFTVSFLLEALHHLRGDTPLSGEGESVVKAKCEVLVQAILGGPPALCGGVALQEYEATAFLTFKAVSALGRWDRLEDVREQVETWNWNHLYKESVLVASDSADADVFEVAYSALIATAVAELDQMTPQQRSLLAFGVDQFFRAQRKDGTWPRSRPLFVYRELGHAYCYDYELLAALLSEPQLRSLMGERLGRLHLAAHALDERKYPLKTTASAVLALAQADCDYRTNDEAVLPQPATGEGDGESQLPPPADAGGPASATPTEVEPAIGDGTDEGDGGEANGDVSRQPPYGWSSGHHGTYAAAESWATAAALHFAFALGQLVAERIREETFAYVGVAYTPPSATPGSATLPKEFLDSILVEGPPIKMLKECLESRMIAPLIAVRGAPLHGKKLPKKTAENVRVPTSAILFGPPGTAKSELAELLAKSLGWPLLAIDPSHLTRRGLDAVHSEASTLFGMLERCEQVVVLLDEFDELVREREGPTDMESRFLTTAMLPKLTALYKARRILYLVATNHVEQFDAAIRRRGRFDLIMPVLPPTCEEKERKWPELKHAIEQMQLDAQEKARAGLADLIFLEADDLAGEVAAGGDVGELIAQFADQCILRQDVDPRRRARPVTPPGPATETSDAEPDETRESWKERMAREAPKRIRGL